MNSERRDIADLDALVKSALPDDLPADVADGMRERIDRFRDGRARTQAAGLDWIFRRSVWAVLSLLMLVAGILLQGSNASSPLARRIASLKAAPGTVEPMRR